MTFGVILDALPENIRNNESFALKSLSLAWRLDAVSLTAKIEERLSQPPKQAGPELLKKSAGAITAGNIKLELIVSGDDAAADKLAQLAELPTGQVAALSQP